MKKLFLLSALALSSAVAHANTDNCTADIEKVLSNLAPATGEVKITGKYSKKSESGEFKACSLSIRLDGTRLVPSYTHEEFNPSNGDGGAFWPFGSYPTEEVPTNDWNRLKTYSCSASADSFKIDYSYKSLSGWRKSSRYTLGLEKNRDGSYSASLRAGNGSVRDDLVTCIGTISE